MKPDNWSSSNWTYRMLAGFMAVVLFCLVLSAPGPRGETRLSLSYPDYSGLAEIKLSGFDLGLGRLSKDRFGLGFGLGDERLIPLGDWELSPFLTGTVSSEKVSPSSFTGGLKASYFNYRIGGWAFSSTSHVWVKSSGYSLASSGSYGLGNLSLAYDLQYEHGFEEQRPWFPAREGSSWAGLARRGFWGFENTNGSHLTLSGGRRVALGDENLKWNQGIILDFSEDPGGIGLVTKFNYRDSFFLAEVDGLKIDGWALQLTGERLSIGFVDYKGNREKYGISIGYHGANKILIEITEYGDDPGTMMNLTVKW